MHPLRQAYVDAIRDEYGYVLYGDKHPEKTDVASQRVRTLGINYSLFVRMAIQMWADWCENKKHKYPYWNIVISDKSFEMIGKVIALSDDALRLTDVEYVSDVDYDEFTAETSYALEYIDWMNGNQDDRPIPTELSMHIKVLVAEYVCTLEGIPFISSNYNTIASQLRDNGHSESGRHPGNSRIP